MATLTIVNDQQLELAVLVDVDTFKPLPLVAAGPDREALLQAFADSVPFDLTLLNDDTIREGFAQFLSARGVITQDTAQPPAVDAAVSSDGAGLDDGAALAEHEATNTTDTPAPAPDDTDTDASTPVTTVTGRCWNCQGSGFVEFGDGSPQQQCGICQGTGKAPVAVQ